MQVLGETLSEWAGDTVCKSEYAVDWLHQFNIRLNIQKHWHEQMARRRIALMIAYFLIIMPFVLFTLRPCATECGSRYSCDFMANWLLFEWEMVMSTTKSAQHTCRARVKTKGKHRDRQVNGRKISQFKSIKTMHKCYSHTKVNHLRSAAKW